MKYIFREFHHNIPGKELISDLRKTARRLGRDFLGMDEYSSEGRYDASTLSRRFGSWNAACKKAGLKVRRQKFIGRKELLANLKQVWDSLGRQPYYEEMKWPRSKYSVSTYKREFGSWLDACRVFIQYMMKHKKIVIQPRKRKTLKERRSQRSKRQITKGMRYDVLRRDNFTCVCCGSSPVKDPTIKLHVDHLVPVSKGGVTTIGNLRTVCADCNLGKWTKDEKSRSRKTARNAKHAPVKAGEKQKL